MAETVAQRIAQLESIVNELTTRVAADQANTDLPPLLAAAKAELADLQTPPSASTVAATPAASAASAASAAVAIPAPAATAVPAAAAAPQAAAKLAVPVSRPKVVAPAVAPAMAKAATKPQMSIKPMPPTVPAVMTGRPNPARPRPLQTSSRAGR